MAQALRVPMREAARPRLEQRARGALNQIAMTLRRSKISAKARVQFAGNGGRIVVYVQGPFAVEASLLIPAFIDSFKIQVV